MKDYNTSFMLIVLLLPFFLIGPLIAQDQIPASVLSGGGEKQVNAEYTLIGTVGQISVESMTTSGYQAHSGFWNVYSKNLVSSVGDGEVIPMFFNLEQNYPNPFNPSTVIKFTVAERSNVVIKVYDVLGSIVTSMVNEEMEPGIYQRIFDASIYSSGLYLYKMEAGSYVSTKKMLLVK